MRKIFNMMILSVLLTVTFLNTAYSSDELYYSVSAFDEYCGKWNDYYVKANPRLGGSYLLSDDKKDIGACFITYNEDHFSMDYPSNVIPLTASVMVMFMPAQSTFMINIMDDNLKSDLESVVIHGKDNKTITPDVRSDHDPYNAWSIMIWPSEVFDLYYLNSIKVDLKIDGKQHSIEINNSQQSYLYKMFDWQFGGFLYASIGSDNFKDKTFLPAEVQTAANAATGGSYSFRDDIDGINKAAKSVFYVETYDESWSPIATASGFVTFDEHLFVTNQHVIDGASFLRIVDDDNNSYVINKVVASDKKQDIAILLFPEGINYDSLPLNVNGESRRGESVVAIGSPKGLQNSVSKGDISAIREENGVGYIQISAAISHGSSGGALFNNSGEVIGITTSGIDEGQNLNFARPIKAVQDLYNRWNKSDYETLGTEAASVVGLWYLKTLQTGTMNVEASALGMVVTLDVKKDASFTMDAIDTMVTGTWVLNGNSLALTAEGTTINAVYADETLTVAREDEQMVFTKEEQKVLTLAPVKANASAEEFEGNWNSTYVSSNGQIVPVDVSQEFIATLKIEKGQMSINGEGVLSQLTGGLTIPLNYESGQMTYTLSTGSMSITYTAVMLKDGMLALTTDIGIQAITIYCTKIVK